MTQPLPGSAPPPAPVPPLPPPQPARPATPTAPATPPGGTAPARRTAWAEGVDRLRAGATTEPGRLRIIGAVLAALVLGFGAVTAWQVTQRADAASAVVHRSRPLSADAAGIYRSLADADTTAAVGFLSGGQWPRAVRERYERDVRTASTLLAKAAAGSGDSGAAGNGTAGRAAAGERRHIDTLTTQLPVYTGLIEQARANNRQGLPLGGAYLRYANGRMRGDLLPAARALYESETGGLADDYADAESWPWPALATGGAALAALVWAQRRDTARTNRVFNPGLLAATATSAALLLWLVSAHAVAWSGLTTSYDDGARSLQVLNEARITALQARGDEALTLVARGAVLTEDGEDFYETGYRAALRRLAGDDGTGRGNSGGTDGGAARGTDGGAAAGRGTLLGTAERLADDRAGRSPVTDALRGVQEWRTLHQQARATDESGRYEDALRKVIGDTGTDAAQADGGKGTPQVHTTGADFDRVDASLVTALAHEQREFRQAADGGRRAFTGLAAGAAALAVLGAVGALLGIGRRLSEYR